MQRITLDQLLIEGFKCFRDKTIVQFPDKGGFYFLTGNNGPEPRLGANGAGKSSLWDALCWCWYGVSVRGNKASEITSWGVKRAHVANDFTIGDTRHRVERWGSPDRLVLDGVVIAQPALDTVLGLSRQRFLHSVLFGQGAPLFLDLTVPQRGDLLDEVLDLGLWMRLSKRASTRVATMEKALIEHRKEIAYNEGRLRGLPDENLLRQQEANWNADNDANLTNIANQIEKLEAAVDVLDKRVTHLAGQRAKLPNIDATNATMRGLDTALSDKRVEITRITDARQRDNALVAFYRSHKDCPTCKQGLSEDFIASQIHTLERDVAGASVDLDALHDQFETIMAAP
jgi:DNA repair exonuclease SbcCD ATPase subunit